MSVDVRTKSTNAPNVAPWSVEDTDSANRALTLKPTRIDTQSLAHGESHAPSFDVSTKERNPMIVVWGEITPQFKTREEAEGQALVRNHEGAKPNA